MFKYPQKSTTPSSPSPFAGADVPSDWAAPASQPGAASMPSEPSSPFFGAAEPTSPSPFDASGSEPVATSAVTRNVLNSDVSVVGTLRFTDDLLVDGSVEGEITSDGVLTVGANASIQAGEQNKVAVRTKSAIIHGKVMGDVVVTDRVELSSTAELVGDVTASKISIQEGAVFVGHCRVGAPVNMPVAAPAPKRAAKAAGKAADGNLLG